MYYTPPRRRPVRHPRPPMRRARPATTYYVAPDQRGRIYGEKIVPAYQSVMRRPRRLIVRTRTIQVIVFLIVLGLLAWYSGLLALLLTKIIPAQSSMLGPAPRTALVYPGQHSIQGVPTISAAKIDSILCNAGSPACGSGQEIYMLGVQANINPAYALAFFQHESSFGTTGVARYSRSLGNLRCIPNYPCPDGYAAFPSWSAGFQAWYTLIDSDVYVKSGHTSIETIIPIYAPPSDNNNDAAYINSVVGAVQSWQQEKG